MYEIMEASRDDVDAASFDGIPLPSALKQHLIKVLKAVQLVHKHKHNASAAGKQGEVARAKLKKGLIGVTDDEVKGLQEAWQEVRNVCNPRETAGVLREHAYAVRLLDGPCAVRTGARARAPP